MGRFERGLTMVLVLLSVLTLLGYKGKAKGSAVRGRSDLHW
jgi:hypothetical protein